MPAYVYAMYAAACSSSRVNSTPIYSKVLINPTPVEQYPLPHRRQPTHQGTYNREPPCHCCCCCCCCRWPPMGLLLLRPLVRPAKASTPPLAGAAAKLLNGSNAAAPAAPALPPLDGPVKLANGSRLLLPPPPPSLPNRLMGFEALGGGFNAIGCCCIMLPLLPPLELPCPATDKPPNKSLLLLLAGAPPAAPVDHPVLLPGPGPAAPPPP